MTGWLRRVRGAIGMGITWALGWAPVGALLGLGLALGFAPAAALFQIVVVNATVLGGLGFIGGTIFSTLVGVTEGRHSFEELTLPRFTLLGGAGGLLLGGLTVVGGLWGVGLGSTVALVLTATTTVLGAASAAGTLAIARRARDEAGLGSHGGWRGALGDGG